MDDLCGLDLVAQTVKAARKRKDVSSETEKIRRLKVFLNVLSFGERPFEQSVSEPAIHDC
jgi:hypothetical protein